MKKNRLEPHVLSNLTSLFHNDHILAVHTILEFDCSLLNILEVIISCAVLHKTDRTFNLEPYVYLELLSHNGKCALKFQNYLLKTVCTFNLTAQNIFLSRDPKKISQSYIVTLSDFDSHLSSDLLTVSLINSIYHKQPRKELLEIGTSFIATYLKYHNIGVLADKLQLDEPLNLFLTPIEHE